MVNKKLMCNIDERLLARVDEYAQRMSITRTAAVSVLLSRGLESEGVVVAEQQKPTLSVHPHIRGAYTGPP